MEGLVDAVERTRNDALVVAEQQAGQDDDEADRHQVAAQSWDGPDGSTRTALGVADRLEAVTSSSCLRAPCPSLSGDHAWHDPLVLGGIRRALPAQG